MTIMANAVLAAAAVVLALGFWLLGACAFLIPYRLVIVRDYGVPIAMGACVLFVNLVAAFHAASRWLLLKDTGEKLAHLDKQLRTSRGVSHELAQLLQETSRDA